jgi:hypothetical protein
VLAFGDRKGPERAPEILAQMGEGGVGAGVGELSGHGGVLEFVNRKSIEEIGEQGILRECTG